MFPTCANDFLVKNHRCPSEIWYPYDVQIRCSKRGAMKRHPNPSRGCTVKLIYDRRGGCLLEAFCFCFFSLTTAAACTIHRESPQLVTYIPPHPPREMNFDQILSTIGGFGKYQKILYIWICLPQILLAFHMMVSIFTGATPPYQCRDGADVGVAILNSSLQDSSCFSGDAPLLSNRTESVPCAHGWEYSRETFQSTTVTEVSE